MGLIRQRTGFFANRPVLTATTAASGGVLLGAYVAMQIFAAPVPNEAKVPAAPPVADAKPPVKQVEKFVETTGVAPAKEDVAAADRCQGQTWPYLSRDCTEQMQKNRPARAVATDRVDKPVPEGPTASPTHSVAALPAPSAPAAPPPTGAASGPAARVGAAPNGGPSAPSEPVEPVPPKPSVAAAPPASLPPAVEPAPRAQAPVAASAPANSQQDAPKSVDKSAEKRKIKQARERARKQERDRQNLDEGDGLSFAGVERSRETRDRADDERLDRADRRSLRAESRSDRPRRERVVGSRDDDGEEAVSERRGRRVIVIERGGGESRGGLFGGLFGGGLFGN